MQLFINNWSSALALPATASAVQLSVPEADAARLVGLGELGVEDAGGPAVEDQVAGDQVHDGAPVDQAQQDLAQREVHDAVDGGEPLLGVVGDLADDQRTGLLRVGRLRQRREIGGPQLERRVQPPAPADLQPSAQRLERRP